MVISLGILTKHFQTNPIGHQFWWILHWNWQFGQNSKFQLAKIKLDLQLLGSEVDPSASQPVFFFRVSTFRRSFSAISQADSPEMRWDPDIVDSKFFSDFFRDLDRNSTWVSGFLRVALPKGANKNNDEVIASTCSHPNWGQIAISTVSVQTQLLHLAAYRQRTGHCVLRITEKFWGPYIYIYIYIYYIYILYIYIIYIYYIHYIT